MSWDYDKYVDSPAIHEIEKSALLGSEPAVQALIELERGFRKLFDEGWEGRHLDGCISEKSAWSMRKDLEDVIENAIEISKL